MQWVSKPLQRHVESSVPSNHLRSRPSEQGSNFADLRLRALPHVGGLVELPNLRLRDLVICSRKDGLGHVRKGLVISDLLVGEFVLEQLVVWGKGVESSLAFVVESCCEEHDKGSGIKIADGELDRKRVTSLSKR